MPRKNHTAAEPATHPLQHPALSDSLRELARRGVLRRYAKGTLLIQEDDIGDTIYIVAAGRLRAFSVNPANGREITYGTYGPGEYVGEMGFDGGPRAASVVTLEPTTCALVTRRTLEAFIAEHPAFAFELLAKLIRRARAATLTAKQLALNDVYGRLKLLVESMAEARSDGTRHIAERLTHQEIAHRIGCTREMVSRVMKDLQTGGCILPAAKGWVIARPLPARW
jgi:CRP/FNR family cyclic AMP-dependent transcriptional regulator